MMIVQNLDNRIARLVVGFLDLSTFEWCEICQQLLCGWKDHDTKLPGTIDEVVPALVKRPPRIMPVVECIFDVLS